MFNIIMKIISLIIILIGVTLVYDARLITKRFFSFGDQNEGASGLKILGFFISIIGAVIWLFLSK